MQLNCQHLSEHCLHKWADSSVSAPGNIKSFSQVCGHPLAPSGMVTLDLLPMRNHTCNAGGLREGVESQGGQIRARGRVKAATQCVCWLLQRGSCRHGWKEVRREPLAAPYQLRMQEGHRWHEGWQKSWRCTKEPGPGWRWWVWPWKGTAVTAAWSQIKVQMPTEEFLQKNSTVIAMYRSCLGYSFSKCSL